MSKPSEWLPKTNKLFERWCFASPTPREILESFNKLETELVDKEKQLAERTRQRDAYKKALEIAEDELMTARAKIERLSSRDGNAKHELVYDDGDNPFAREKLEHIDFGVCDNQYVLESHLLNNALEGLKAKDKLIEQMRALLNAVVARSYYIDCADIGGKNWFDARDAALAAERGEG